MKGKPALLAALLCLTSPSFSSPAGAAYDPVASGTATLTLDKSFATYLRRNGVELTATGPARRKGQKLALPVSGGEWDPTTGKGTLEAEGSLVFQGARGKVPLRDLVLKAKRTPLYAKVGGGQLKVAAAKKVAAARAGFGAKLTATKLALSAKVATRLNKKLRPREPFTANQPIGALTARAQPATVAVLPTGRASLAPTAAFLAKLDSLHVSVNPIAPAELAPGPLFSFPIVAAGQIAPSGTAGTLRTGGELEFLKLGAGQVFWREQWLDLGGRADLAEVDLRPSPPYGGKQGQVGILGIGAGGVSSDPAARTVSVSAAPLTLSAATAQAFNEAFAEGKAAFAAGEALGGVSFVAQGQ